MVAFTISEILAVDCNTENCERLCKCAKATSFKSDFIDVVSEVVEGAAFFAALSLSFLLIIVYSCNNKQSSKEINTMETNKKTTLQSKLDEKKKNFELKADDNKKRAYNEGQVSVEKSGIVSSAKQLGEKAPNFTLNNALGQPVELYDYLKKGNVVLTWYRGGWCPYCNITLHELQQELPNFKANGATLIALTPELHTNLSVLQKSMI